MTKLFVKPGKTLTIVAGSTIASGDPIQTGKLFGVALTDIATGASGEIGLEGVYTLTKDGTTIAQGADVYHDGTDATGDSAGNEHIGAANLAAAGGAGTVEVRLDGIATITGS